METLSKEQEIREQLSFLSELKKENERLKVLKDSKKSISELVEDFKEYSIEDEGSEDVVDEFASEVDFYYSNIYEFEVDKNDSSSLEKICEFLPSKENDNYENIINRILANIELEIYEYVVEIERLKDECTEEELLDYKEELEKLRYKKYLIKEYISLSPQELSQVNQNKIVLVMKNQDSSYVYDDLNKISSEYYEGFIDLFKTIEDGTFKNVKCFRSTNNKNKGVCEVKGFKRRLLFDRIGPHTYAIYAAFVKKSDNDKDYREFVINRYSLYRCKRKGIINELNTQDFNDNNYSRLDSLYTLIGRENTNSEVNNYGL